MKQNKLLIEFIKKTIRENLNENIDSELQSIALEFIKKHLDIKSSIILKHSSNKMYNYSITNASVGFSKSNKFIINIDLKDTKFGFVRNLAHELVHVKQMEDGRLRVIDNKIKFGNKVYTKDEYKKAYHSDEIPKFEEEAFEQERIIANLFWNSQRSILENKLHVKNISEDLNKFIRKTIKESKSSMNDKKVQAFKVLGRSPYELIAKVLYDEGITTEKLYIEWLKTISSEHFPKYLIVNVQGAIRDLERNFTNHKTIPNIFNLK